MDSSLLGTGAATWQGTHYRTILKTEDTGGALSIVDSVSQPGSGPPRHVHHDADETFVMLSGECQFWLDGETRFCEPGETMFVPRGTEHTFRVIGNRPSRHLIVLTPGGFEGFFEKMAEGQFAIPQDMAAITEIARRFHLEFSGPPLTSEN